MEPTPPKITLAEWAASLTVEEIPSRRTAQEWDELNTPPVSKQDVRDIKAALAQILDLLKQRP